MTKKIHRFILIFFLLNLLFIKNTFASIDTTICKGAKIKLSSTNISSSNTYLWSTGETTESIFVSPTSTTTYRVETTLTTGIIIDEFKVIVDEPVLPPAIKFVVDRLISTNDPAYRVRWLRNNSILYGQNSDTLKFPLEGVYKSEVSRLGGCWTSSQLLYVSQDTDTANITYSVLLFPNPSNGYFNILLSMPRKVSKNILVIVSDLSGRMIFEKKQFVFQSLSSKIPIRLPAGYKGQAILSILVNGIKTNQQIIIQ